MAKAKKLKIPSKGVSRQVTRLMRKEIKAEIERVIMAGKRLILAPVAPYKGKRPLTLRDWLRGDKKLRWTGTA